MFVKSSGISNGEIELVYGKFGHEFYKGMPTYSLPFEVFQYPKETVGFALTLIDYDAVPVVGFPFIHWIATNIMQPFLPIDASKREYGFVQGVNSYASSLLHPNLTRQEASCYGGMTPPDKAHRYLLTIYALTRETSLTEGFYLNELLEQLDGNVCGIASVVGIYPSSIERN